MKTDRIRCMSLPKTGGVQVPQFEKLSEALSHVKGDETKLVDVLNKYGRQKDSLVNARDYISEQVDIGGFKRLTKKGAIPTDDTEFSDYETETNHIDRFVAAAITGKATFAGLTVTGADDKLKSASVWTFLQGVLDKHGPFPFDLNATVRTGRSGKIGKTFYDVADKIIANNSQQTWIDRWTKGYKNKQGVEIPVIPFASFIEQPAKGARTEDVDKIKVSNRENLARALSLDFDAYKQATAASLYA